jgi:hypothetical protein
VAHNYSQNIPWPILKAHLEHRQREVMKQWTKATGEAASRLQGAGATFEELMNLPVTLEVLEAEKEKDDAKG